jgi:hypothetical protein
MPDATPTPTANPSAPAPARAALKPFADFGGVWGVLFGVGAFLAIVFTFMPLISQAKVASRKADVTAAERDHNARLRKLVDENQKSKIQETEKTFARKKEELEDRVEAARVSAAQSAYWDRYFLMFGFVFLMLGSLGFLMPGQPLIRRIVGAVVLSAEVILVFVYFLVRGSVPDAG